MSNLPYPHLPILVVDDEEQALNSMCTALNSAGLNNIECIQRSDQVLTRLKKQETGIILLDLKMPPPTGEELLGSIVSDHPDVPVIIVTARNEVDIAVKCIKLGAFDYLVKPVDRNHLIAGVERAVKFSELQWENKTIRDSFFSDKIRHPEVFTEIITQNEKMRAVFHYIEAIANTSQPILITGETGTGKGLLAKSIQKLSNRGDELITVNIAGIDDSFFTDTLFGHKRGAFTGAGEDRKGIIDQASGGTLFLDEIGDLSMASQVKLLRLIEDREYYPIGSDLPKRTNVRFIIATSHDLKESTESGKFRKELYFRLKTHHVHIPPLRERMDDIPLLLDHFIGQAAKKLKKKKPAIPEELLTMLRLYHYPGNIRELQAIVFDAVSSHESKILSTQRFKERMNEQKTLYNPQTEPLQFPSQYNLPTLREAEGLLISEALNRSNSNQSIAANLLGISRQALNQRLKKKTE
jgi:DNA-binding NtrC family response regulator